MYCIVFRLPKVRYAQQRTLYLASPSSEVRSKLLNSPLKFQTTEQIVGGHYVSVFGTDSAGLVISEYNQHTHFQHITFSSVKNAVCNSMKLQLHVNKCTNTCNKLRRISRNRVKAILLAVITPVNTSEIKLQYDKRLLVLSNRRNSEAISNTRASKGRTLNEKDRIKFHSNKLLLILKFVSFVWYIRRPMQIFYVLKVKMFLFF